MNLKEIRVSRKLKVQEVSDYLCCLPSVYSRYENGKREPSIDILLKLSKLYGVSVDCLIGNDEVVDTSITEKEAAMISAMRQADERARQDAIALLELHTGNKKNLNREVQSDRSFALCILKGHRASGALSFKVARQHALL